MVSNARSRFGVVMSSQACIAGFALTLDPLLIAPWVLCYVGMQIRAASCGHTYLHTHTYVAFPYHRRNKFAVKQRAHDQGIFSNAIHLASENQSLKNESMDP